MNRITNLFQTQKDGILSVYFTAGYPNLNDTASILKALQAKGIHMVEVGIPFSDPMADGPVIQEAATQALRNGMSLHLLFEQLKEIRSERTDPDHPNGLPEPHHAIRFREILRELHRGRRRRNDHPRPALCRLYLRLQGDRRSP